MVNRSSSTSGVTFMHVGSTLSIAKSDHPGLASDEGSWQEWHHPLMQASGLIWSFPFADWRVESSSVGTCLPPALVGVHVLLLWTVPCTSTVQFVYQYIGKGPCIIHNAPTLMSVDGMHARQDNQT